METTNDRLVVSGGCLAPGMAWLPTKESVIGADVGKKFLVMTKQNNKLGQLCGVNVCNNTFLDKVRAERHEVCQDIVKKMFNEKVEEHVHKSQMKVALAKFVRANEEHLPTCVDVVVDGVSFVVLFETDHRKAVSLLCDSESMTSFTQSVASAPTEMDSVAKKSKFVQQYHYPEIKYNPARRVPCVRYVDVDGQPRYYSKAPKGDDEASLNEALEDIHQHYIKNAVAEVGEGEVGPGVEDEQEKAEGGEGAHSEG